MLLRAQLGFIYEGGAQYRSCAAYKELELRQGYTCFQSKDRSQSTHDGSEGEGKIQGSHEREREIVWQLRQLRQWQCPSVFHVRSSWQSVSDRTLIMLFFFLHAAFFCCLVSLAHSSNFLAFFPLIPLVIGD